MTSTALEPDWLRNVYAGGVPAEIQQKIVELSHLFKEFETIGTNCRFGFVQRAYQCEPISLLRWAGGLIPALLKCLDESWAGVDDPKNMRFEYRKDLGHFLLCIDRYGLIMHTTEEDEDVDQTALRQKYARLNAFLRRKLLTDLSNAEKHFIVFIDTEHIQDDAIQAISAKIKGFNPNNTILFVHHSKSVDDAGTVDFISTGVARGTVREIDNIIGGGLIYPDWIEICTRVRNQWKPGPI